MLTYRWIDELQEAAYKTLGSIAGRAIGYLAPEVALGGAIVSAGLIETDALDRDGVTAYLNELAENNPDLMDHMSGGGGCSTACTCARCSPRACSPPTSGAHAARGGLRAIGVDPFPADAVSAFRDSAGSFVEAEAPERRGRRPAQAAAPALARGADGQPRRRGPAGSASSGSAPAATSPTCPARSAPTPVGCGWSAPTPPPTPARWSARSRGRHRRRRPRDAGRLRRRAAPSAAEVAATAGSPTLRGRPGRHRRRARPPRCPGSPSATRVLSLEDRADPVALLGSLINASVANRLTVVFDGGDRRRHDVYVAGARAADSAEHPELRAEISRMQELGYLAGLTASVAAQTMSCTNSPELGEVAALHHRHDLAVRGRPRSRRCPSAAGARG